MAKKAEPKGLTRAQKTEATKSLIKEILALRPTRHNDLIDEVAKEFVLRHGGEDTENINDVKGRVGSVLDIMKKESEITLDEGTYALKARLPLPPVEVALEKPVKKTTKKKEPKKEQAEAETPEKPVKKRATAKKKGEPKTEEVEAPVPVEAPAPKEEAKVEDKPAPKKRGRKPKAEAPQTEPVPENKTEAPAEEVKAEEKPVEAVEVKEEKPQEKVEKVEEKAIVAKPKAEIAQRGVVMDMSFLFGDKKPAPPKKTEDKPQEKPVEKTEKVEKPTPQPSKKPEVKGESKPEVKAESKPAPKAEEKPVQRTEEKPKTARKPLPMRKTASAPMTAEEKLKEDFLKRMRSLGGDYFEYYSIYLLERYSIRNGRRLEGLRVSGGDHDGGIDGEIELTDRLGFKETIYIQSKNWDPSKGKEESWVVGETLLQQFIGACACRQAKDGKQHCRGIFITTSRFTPDAKKILEDMADKIVGYDGADLFETAKECGFGVIKRNGEWVLDERLLSGEKAFFQMM